MFLAPRVYLTYSRDELQRVNATLSCFLNQKRRGNADVDSKVWKELLEMEKYYNQLTGKKGISGFRRVLGEKWKAIYVILL